jgi:hypothetical protein
VYGNPLPDVASAANVKGIGVNRLLDLLKQAFMQEDGKLPRRAPRLAGAAADGAGAAPMALEAAPEPARMALGGGLGGLGEKLAGGLERVVEAVGGDEGGGGAMEEEEEEEEEEEAVAGEAEAAAEDPFPGPPSRGGVMDGIMDMSREATPLGASHSHSLEGAEDDYFPGTTPQANGGEDHFPPPPPVEEEEEEEAAAAGNMEDAASPAGDEGDENPREQEQEQEQEHFPPASAHDEELKAADSDGSQPPNTPPM